MLDTLQAQLQLPASTLALGCVVALVAGMVRGFSGFGLSALIMAALALLIPPIALIPICFLLEAVSSAVMFRGGLADGNRRMVLALVGGYVVGIPLGLATTHAVSPELSRSIALALILTLSLLHLLNATPAFLKQHLGVYIAGFAAGIATGLASVGGMVIALYVLALQLPTRQVRGSLVLFLCLSMVVTASWLLLTETLDFMAAKRAAFLAPWVVVGVLAGTWLFRPSLEPYYKRFCLVLLLSLASVGLLRLVLS